MAALASTSYPPLQSGPVQVPGLNPGQNPASGLMQASPFDVFERYEAPPTLEPSRELIRQLAMRPGEFWRLKQQLSVGLHSPDGIQGTISTTQPNGVQTPKIRESLTDRMQMFLGLKTGLDVQQQQKLDMLLGKGTLTDISADDGHSTLFHLYQRMNTPAAPGLGNRALVGEMLDFLVAPYEVTQKPAPLLPGIVKRIQDSEMAPLLSMRPRVYHPHRHSEDEMQIHKTFNCPGAAIMYGMGDLQPSELIRQLNGLTSPARSFLKKVNLLELSPENPQEALAYFAQNGLRYTPTSPTEGLLQVEAPYAVYLRALSDQNNPDRTPGTRNTIQTLYQMTLVDLPDRMAYDEVNDLMYNPDGTMAGEGLPGEQIDVVSSIIEGGGGTQSVTTQAFGPKPNPKNEREANLPYLFGYKLSFQQIEAALIESLKQKRLPMLGITYTDEDGGMPGGHYFRVTGANMIPTQKNPQGELFFIVVDSDDGNPKPVPWSAAELIPMINRMHLPTAQAKRLNDQINAQPPTMVLTPGDEEARQYQLANLCQDGITPNSAPTPSTPANNSVRFENKTPAAA